MDGSIGETYNLCSKLRQRLRELNAVRDNTQIKLNEAADQLQKLVAKAPKKLRETNVQLESKIQELENNRTRSSISLSAEKDILRQIAAVKKQITHNDEVAKAEKVIQEKKAGISTQKDNLRNLSAQIAELESVLLKMELAQRLGCSPVTLTTRIVDCPQDKLGQIIGKMGINLKQLEDKSGCIIDVDKVQRQIHIQGNDAAISSVVNELEVIIRSTTEDVTIDLAMYAYLTAKRMAGLHKLMQLHPEVHFDVSKDSMILQVRGLPEYLDAAKRSIMALDPTIQTLTLNGRQASLIIGKGGSQINQFIDTFDVSIDVEKKGDFDEATIVGLGTNPQKAVTKIQELLFQNEDVERTILVRTIVKNKLLSDSGSLIKRLQHELVDACGSSVMVHVHRDEDQKSSLAAVIVKGPRSVIDQATERANDYIQKYESAVLAIHLDVNTVSLLLEKGGSTINKLRDRFSDEAEISLSRENNEILVLSQLESVKEIIKGELDQFAAQNQVHLFKVDSSLLGLIFGSKHLRDKLQSLGVVLQRDSSIDSILIRGSSEKISSASLILNDFIVANYSEDFEYPEEDEQFLFTRNIFHKLQESHDVKIIALKGKRTAIIRGNKQNVDVCADALRVLLFGDDDNPVIKLMVPSIAIGLIIGKNGSVITQLEQKYEGVTITVYRSTNCVCLRGPKTAVDGCRAAIILKLSTVSVQQQIELSPVMYETLKVSRDMVCSIQDETTVQVTFNEYFLKLKGIASQVSEAKALFDEVFTGTYSTNFDFDTSLIKRIENVFPPTIIESFMVNSKCSLTIDWEQARMTISGKRSYVQKLKRQVLDAFVNALPESFACIKVPKPLVKTMNNPSRLAFVSAKSASSIYFDIDTFCIVIQSASAHNKTIAMELLQCQLLDSQRLLSVIQLDQVDFWIMSLLDIKELSSRINTSFQCILRPFYDDLMISISGPNEDLVQSARSLVGDAIELVRKENFLMDIPESAFSAFAGRNNANMIALARDHGVSIERVKKNSSKIRIRGDDLTSAIVAINDWLRAWESKNAHISRTEYIQKGENRSVTLPDKMAVQTNVNEEGALQCGKYDGNKLSAFPTDAGDGKIIASNPFLLTCTNHRTAENEVECISHIPTAVVKTSVDEWSQVSEACGNKVSGALSLYNFLSSSSNQAGTVANRSEGQHATINGSTYYRGSSGIKVRL